MESFRNPLIMSLSSLFGVYYPMFGAKTKGLPRGIAVRWALVLLALTSGMGGVQAGRVEHVCRSIDIRNRVDHFSKLENCTVIEGKLHIQLIDYADSSDYGDLQFPKLVEITQYLLLYRVYGLKTLSHIFPNLSVIRGQELFFNYALVVFEVPNFEELGLRSLQVISRGAVRIEKNPNLCYIDTIDWTKITSPDVKMEDNFILQNKDIDECVNVCPKDETDPSRPNVCPAVDTEDQGTHFLCWNSESCQIVCPAVCGKRGCYMEVNSWGKQMEQCCDPLCLGGCTGKGPDKCIACRDVFFDGRCQTQCPPETFKYLDRRCLLADQCRTQSMGSMVRGVNTGHANLGWKLYEGQCVEECPSGYTEDKEDIHLCAKCDGMCPKVCPGIVVDNVAAAQKLKGCTRIDGILEIQIRGGSHVGSELEENLGSIEEIKYFIKIVRSYAIISLRFLKNLRIIHGERLHNDRYALFILDNQNLQDIWDFDTHPNLTIAKGKAFFHFNRKLCLNKIDRLVDSVPGLRNQTDEKDVDPATNGDQVACDISQLKLDVVATDSGYAIVRWENFHLSDSRQLLNWVVNYREAPEKNITVFNARDACGMDDWLTVDVRPDSDKDARHVAAILVHLKPFTQYAVYVQSYTIATADRGAISSIVYLTTEPDVPTTARDIKATSKIPGELHITWKEPTQPNGLVTHYYVYWQLQPLDPNKFDKRNYCINKLRLPSTKKQDVIEEKKNETMMGQCCACPKSKEEVRIEEQERMFQIEFENFLHNIIYIKRPMPIERRRRRAAGTPSTMVTNGANPYSVLSNFTNYMNMSGHLNHSQPEQAEEHEPYEAAVVYNKTELTLTNLKHFQEYSIEVIACHDYQVGVDKKRCSNRAITTARTLPDDTTDSINEKNITIRNNTTNSVHITWPDPLSPNGLIVTYELELNKVDTANFKPYTFCLTHKQYRQIHGYRSDSLNPGNWSFRIRATSLAGNGSWTPLMFFWVAEQGGPTNNNVTLIAVVTSVVLVVLIVATLATVCAVVKKRLNANVPAINYISVNPEYWSTEPVYVADEWEVDRSKISLNRELGQGSFGMVYEGIANGLKDVMDELRVAVKTVNEKASIRDRMEFLNEASVMKAFNCNHVVRLLGVVSKQPTWVIMELMANGDLKNYLRMHRPDETDNLGRKPPSLKEILQMAGEIADGMAYLASKKYVHCDLAARNCMVAENHTVKIGDFGMTRDIYETDYYRKGGKGLLPVRWMSPESLKDGVFTSQSDVWSYGVVLWEMATLAAQPYQGLANEQVLKFVIDGGIMEKPEGCPDTLHKDLMLRCWQHSPKNRPTFQEIIEILVPDLQPSFKDVSWFFSEDRRQQEASNHAREVAAEDEGLELENSNVRTPLAGSPLHSLPGESGCVDDMDMDSIDCESQVSSAASGLQGVPISRQLHPPLREGCVHDQPCDCYVQTGEEGTADHKGSQPALSGGGDSEWRPTPPAQTNNRTNHVDSQPSSAIHSNEGSKGSSKSSGSNHSQLNGIVNGHLPQHYVTPPRC